MSDQHPEPHGEPLEERGDPDYKVIFVVAAIGVIIGVDRLLDMCRTTVNVWGDAVGARIITRIAPDEVE